MSKEEALKKKMKALEIEIEGWDIEYGLGSLDKARDKYELCCSEAIDLGLHITSAFHNQGNALRHKGVFSENLDDENKQKLLVKATEYIRKAAMLGCNFAMGNLYEDDFLILENYERLAFGSLSIDYKYDSCLESLKSMGKNSITEKQIKKADKLITNIKKELNDKGLTIKPCDFCMS